MFLTRRDVRKYASTAPSSRSLALRNLCCLFLHSSKPQNSNYFCYHFAKGQCAYGEGCTFLHLIPTVGPCCSELCDPNSVVLLSPTALLPPAGRLCAYDTAYLVHRCRLPLLAFHQRDHGFGTTAVLVTAIVVTHFSPSRRPKTAQRTKRTPKRTFSDATATRARPRNTSRRALLP